MLGVNINVAVQWQQAVGDWAATDDTVTPFLFWNDVIPCLAVRRWLAIGYWCENSRIDLREHKAYLFASPHNLPQLDALDPPMTL